MSNRIPALVFLLSCSLHAQEHLRFKIGGGSGNGFGGLWGGGGAEVEMYRLAVLGGIGTSGTSEVSWDAGIRYYFRALDKKVRPDVTASYGVAQGIEYGYPGNLDRDALIYGWSFLGGLDHDFGKKDGFVMTYGIGMAIPGDMPQEVKDFFQTAGQPLPKADNAFTASLGIKYQFGL